MILSYIFAKLRRRRYFWEPVRGWATLTLMCIGVLNWLLFAVPSTLAHEFKMGILLASGTDGEAFMDGFRLAVDQSPDVSHPPGEDAGDHLGAVDVELIIVEDAGQPDTALRAALDLIEQQGVAIIIADLPAAALEAIFDPVTQSETLLIATSSTEGLEFPSTPRFFVMDEQGDVNGRFLQGDEAFTVAFREVYGQAPSVAAARGYLAARLIDIAVGATDGNFANGQAFHDALLAANQALVGAIQVEERPLATIPPTAESNQTSTAPPAPVDNPDQEPELLNPTPTATLKTTLDVSQTPTDPVKSVAADEDAKPTSVGIGWIIAVGLVLIVGAALAYFRKAN
jgi:hypothetical protein